MIIIKACLPLFGLSIVCAVGVLFLSMKATTTCKSIKSSNTPLSLHQALAFQSLSQFFPVAHHNYYYSGTGRFCCCFLPFLHDFIHISFITGAGAIKLGRDVLTLSHYTLIPLTPVHYLLLLFCGVIIYRR
jgi:hypothetical protein